MKVACDRWSSIPRAAIWPRPATTVRSGSGTPLAGEMLPTTARPPVDWPSASGAAMPHLTGVVVEVDPPDQRLGQAGHLRAGMRVIVDISIALAVACRLHQRSDGVAEVQGDGLAGRGGGIGGCRSIGSLDGIGLGCSG